MSKANRWPKSPSTWESATGPYKGRRRYRQEGPQGLRDRSSRPHRIPRRTPRRCVRQILALRSQRMVGAEIAVRLDLARSTVARILKREGLGRPKSLDPPGPVCRYQKQHPGQPLHLDIKKLGRIDGIGHRFTGRVRQKRTHSGWEFVHVCVDDASRLSYVEVLPDERKESATSFLHRAVRFFRQHGVRPRAILTDNGGCYRSYRFRDLCRQSNLRHLFTRRYRPQTNSKAERFIQTLLREWAYRIPYRCSRERTGSLLRWLHFYNHHRMHQSLGSLPPI